MVGLHIFICQDAQESFLLRCVFSLSCCSESHISTGISRETLVDDPQLGNERNELVIIAARKLAAAQMIIFDNRVGSFRIKDLGSIAAKYYIKHSSIEIFNQEFKPKMSHADVLAMLSMSSEVSDISGDCGMILIKPSLTKFKCESRRSQNFNS